MADAVPEERLTMCNARAETKNTVAVQPVNLLIPLAPTPKVC